MLDHPQAYYLVWSFLACHLALIILLRDYGGEWALLLVSAARAYDRMPQVAPIPAMPQAHVSLPNTQQGLGFRVEGFGCRVFSDRAQGFRACTPQSPLLRESFRRRVLARAEQAKPTLPATS